MIFAQCSIQYLSVLLKVSWDSSHENNNNNNKVCQVLSEMLVQKAFESDSKESK